MRIFWLAVVIVLLGLAPFDARSQSPFKGCKAEGRGKKSKKNPKGTVSAKNKAQNLLKNRDNGPADSEIDSSVTLAEILKKSNNSKLKNTQGVEITAYVVDVSPGGAA